MKRERVCDVHTCDLQCADVGSIEMLLVAGIRELFRISVELLLLYNFMNNITLLN